MSSNTKRTGKKSLAYIISFSAAYCLPVAVHIIATIISTIKSGAWPGIIAMLLLGALIYAPYYGLYYAALSLIHAVIDLILPPRRKLGYVLAVIATVLVSSSLLVAGSISILVYDPEGLDFGIISLIMGFAWLPIGFMRYIIPDSEE